MCASHPQSITYTCSWIIKRISERVRPLLKPTYKLFFSFLVLFFYVSWALLSIEFSTLLKNCLYQISRWRFRYRHGRIGTIKALWICTTNTHFLIKEPELNVKSHLWMNVFMLCTFFACVTYVYRTYHIFPSFSEFYLYKLPTMSIVWFYIKT